ncbi:MAG TPA: hypothetical protein VFG10_18965 [Saprospiraceae bacterium]|nr:hypothetical protein [Saprospiraceae bacterium]
MKKFLPPFLLIACAALVYAIVTLHSCCYGCDDLNNPEPVVIDTPCIPAEVIEPAFLTMYLDLNEPQTPVTFYAGAYSTTLYLDQPGKPDSIIATLKKFAPQYQYKIYLDDWFKFVVFVEGTNDKTIFQLKVHTRSDDLNQWPTFSIQAFYFGGIITYSHFREIIKTHPSCRSFNFRQLESTVSQRDTLSNDIKGTCQLGRERADFRWNTVNDSIPLIFESLGWNQVLNNFGSGGSSRAYAEEGTIIDARDRCMDDDELLSLLNEGYTVITRA